MNQTVLNRDDVLFRNQQLLAINKPAGVPVHGSKILEDQPRTLLTMVHELEGSPVHAIHRLDRPTSGVMLLTSSRLLLRKISQAFEKRQIKKCYLAVARGWTEPRGTISHALLPPKDDRKAHSVAREAVTRFEQIANVETPYAVPPYSTSRYTLLALYPETGRRHQLRRHMKHISHHLIGDTTYGRGEHNRLFRDEFDCHRLLLHAWALEFEDPEAGHLIRVQAPLDRAFGAIIKQFGWENALDSWAGSYRL